MPGDRDFQQQSLKLHIRPPSHQIRAGHHMSPFPLLLKMLPTSNHHSGDCRGTTSADPYPSPFLCHFSLICWLDKTRFGQNIDTTTLLRKRLWKQHHFLHGFMVLFLLNGVFIFNVVMLLYNLVGAYIFLITFWLSGIIFGEFFFFSNTLCWLLHYVILLIHHCYWCVI